MTADEHIEETLNRAGQTISDLPRGNTERGAYPGKKVLAMTGVCQFEQRVDVSDVSILDCLDYILHLTNVIDRYDEALTRLCDLRDRHVHIVGNVDPPEGVTHEQLNACIEAIIDATEKYRAGLEPWDDWSKENDE